MNTERIKKAAKPLALAALAVVLLGVVYKMFEGSWASIGGAVLQSNKPLLALLLLMGLCWYLLDAAVYWLLFRRAGTPLRFMVCVRAAFISIFSDVFTMGAGTKPGQVFYCHKKGASIGSCASILTLPYLFQKLSIVVLALVGLAGQHAFIQSSFGDAVHYIYLGAGGSILLSAALLACTFPQVHRGVNWLLAKLFRGDRWQSLRENVAAQLTVLAQSSGAILKTPKTAFGVFLLMFCKLALQYSIPVLALLALEGSLCGATLLQVLTMSAIMKLVMGVLPTSGGVGSLELVFALIFKAVFGDVLGGSVMVLFRVATYYFPFLISLPLVGGILTAKAKK